MDTATGPAIVTVTAHLTDDLSGVYASDTDGPINGGHTSYLYAFSPSGGQTVSGSFTKRLSGDRLDGVYQATITLPAFSEQGTWTIGAPGHTGIVVEDAAGNSAILPATTLTAAGYPASFVQAGRGDSTGLPPAAWRAPVS